MPSAKQLQSRYKRKEITKKLIYGLSIVGTVYIACNSPYFVYAITQRLKEYSLKEIWEELKPKEKKQLTDTFSYLRRAGMIEITPQNNQIYVSLTQKGKQYARQFQIDELEIIPQKSWDNTWRILLFDIPEKSKVKREALRGKLKQLGFMMIQKSVWVHAYPCEEELEMLKDFFNFKQAHYLLIEAAYLGHHTKKLKQYFNI